MTQWFRGGGRGTDRTGPPVPPTPGGTGGSGFGAVGDVPPGPEGPMSAGERRDATAGRTRRGGSGSGNGSGSGSGSGGSGPTGAGSAGAGSGLGARIRRAGSGSGSGSGGGAFRGGALRPGSAAAGGTPEERRFSQVYAEDRVGPMPYSNQAVPDVGAARARVRALVDDLLPNGVDEGTGGALDPLIASWASGWLARIDSEHADHHAVVDRLVGGARQQLAEAEASHERDRRALEIARTDYSDARERLMQPAVADEPPAGRGSGPGGRPGGGQGGGSTGGAGLFDRFRRGGRELGPGPGVRSSERVPPSDPATAPFRTPPSTYRPPLGTTRADRPGAPGERAGSGAPSPAEAPTDAPAPESSPAPAPAPESSPDDRP